MPYCSIEEAWKASMPNLPRQDTPSRNPDDGYQYDYVKASNNINPNLPQNKTLGPPKAPVYPINNCNINPNPNMQFSRSYNRLPETSGPLTRLPGIENFNTEIDELVNELRNENIDLKKRIAEITQLLQSPKDNIYDLMLFITCGVLVIFMLETLSKIFRK